MERLGRVELVQIQQNPLKTSNANQDIVYSPDGIMMLEEIRLTVLGIVGIMDFLNRQMEFLDIHHLKHPQSRFRGDNNISMGFTGHYEKIRAEFGNHVRDGNAGENIIVKSDQLLAPVDLGERLAIVSGLDDTIIYLGEVKPIPPCEPFIRFARDRQPRSSRETRADLQLLGGGLRGYYMEVESANEEAVVRRGDLVYRV